MNEAKSLPDLSPTMLKNQFFDFRVYRLSAAAMPFAISHIYLPVANYLPTGKFLHPSSAPFLAYLRQNAHFLNLHSMVFYLLPNGWTDFHNFGVIL